MRRNCFIFTMLMFLLISALPTIEINAASSTYEAGNIFDVSGKYIYYAKEDEGTKTGIMRYNTETGDAKHLYSSKYNGEKTAGFSNIIVKGNYVYAIWDRATKSNSYSEPHIYRFKKNGGGKKELAFGGKFYIKGSKIYYQKQKWEETGISRKKAVGAGYASMSLDGSNVENISSPNFYQIEKKAEKYRLFGSGDQKTIDKGDWSYSAGEEGVWRIKKSSGEKQNLFSPERYHYVTYAEIHGDWIMFQSTQGYVATNKPKARLYVMGVDGSGKALLKRWRFLVAERF